MSVHSHLLAFQQFLASDEIITDPVDIAPFCLDQRGRFQGEAFAVLQPRTVNAVQAIMRYCYAEQLPVTPQGGNTGLCGGATPHASVAGKGVILSLSKLNQVRQLNLADDTITVDAGIILAQVQKAALDAGRYFPLSLASEGSCQIGGNIACNAGGVNVVRYGTARNLVLGLEYVLPNGKLVSHLQPLHKNTTGYAVWQQFIGSEGTLGIITGATLKLFAQPKSTLTAWVGVSSIQQAVELLSALKGHFAERLSSFELISDYALSLSANFSQLAMPTTAPWHILLELSDSIPDVDLTEPLMAVLEQGGWLNAILAQSDTERQHLWTLRENIAAAQRYLGVSIKHDIALPINRIAEFVPTCVAELQKTHPQANIVVFGHLGDGSLHYNVFLPEILDNNAYHFEKEINTVVYETVLAHGGTIAAEHGIGQIKTQWLPWVRSAAELDWMYNQKNYLDPHNIMNPGKVLPSEKTA